MRDDEQTPSKFYKYRSVSGEAAHWVERSILHNEVFFAPASAFNDPFELKPVFSLDASRERQREDFIRLSKKYDPGLTEQEHEAEADRVMATSMAPENINLTRSAIQELHSRAITESVGIYCVSTKNYDILMWSHYADSHRGICLEFEGLSTFMAHAQQVHYSAERFPINPYNDSQDAMMSKALLTKSEHWSYEAEWRLCRYQGGPGVVKFHPENLTGIIIGALAPRTTIDMVRGWIRERTLPVTLYCMAVSNQTFELELGVME